MERILIGALAPSEETLVRVCGWVQVIRNQKRIMFIILRDHTGIIQVVFRRTEETELIARELETLPRESTVEIIGIVKKNEQVKLGQMEIMLQQLTVVTRADSSIPIDESSSQEFRLDWRFLDLRRRRNLLIFQVQTTAEHAMREFWTKNGFIEIHSPKFMESASEGGAELFRVQYFEGTACLAQSPQFYKQMAMMAGFDRIFEIGPVFRANPSFTSRHDTEFTSVDMEVSWIESHEDVMRLEEEWLQFVLSRIHGAHGAAIREAFGVDVAVPTLPFPRVTMAEAYKILADKGHHLSPETKGDLDPEGERLLSAYIKECTGHEFVFVKDYPVSVRPFYHMRHSDAPHLTKSFDLLWKGLEVTTGAQREHQLDVLKRQAEEKGVNIPSIQYYLDFFKFGCPPHGGLGFGLTRMLMVLLGAQNVREVTFLYRGPKRLTP